MTVIFHPVSQAPQPVGYVALYEELWTLLLFADKGTITSLISDVLILEFAGTYTFRGSTKQILRSHCMLKPHYHISNGYQYNLNS